MSIAHKYLLIQYYQYKAVFPHTANLFNTGYFKDILVEILISALMPYKYLGSKPA